MKRIRRETVVKRIIPLFFAGVILIGTILGIFASILM